jgi:hypothetical protein
MDYKCFKGDFTGISKTKDLVLSQGKYNFYNFNWSYIQINNIKPTENYEVENEKLADYYYKDLLKSKSFWRRNSPEILIPITEEHYYDGELHEVIINNFKLDSNDYGYIKKDFIELKGTIYFKIKSPIIKPIISPIVSPSIGTNRSEKIDEINTETNVITIVTDTIDSEITTENSNIITNPTSTTLPSISKNWLSRIFGIFFWLFLLSFFWLFLHQFFFFALFGAIGWLFSRFVNNRFIKTIFNLIFGALLLVFLSTLLSNKGSLIDPTVPKKDGEIKISPPKEVKTEGSNSNDPDYQIEKQINWFDFIKNKYAVKYSTSVKTFFETQKNHSTADKKYTITSTNPVSYFNKLYRNLEQYDSKKIDSIVKLLGKKATAKKLNQIQTAEMVVTFIQEIPYVLVHQNTCQKIIKNEPSNSFIAQYHKDKKPCLAEIPGGVQSPYEFLHNLKGDCDTRSLLGYAILKKMNISASVWVSEAYGHSILGVGLPIGNGVYKNIKGLNHYGVELTNKGFRLGVISPQQRDMSNWDIALYINNFK